mgnify:CR=1 FL=1
METLRLSTKGQVVIPKEIRTRHRWDPGTELVIEDLGDSVVLRTVKSFPPTEVEDGLGCTGYRGPALSIEEMDEAVSEGVRHRWQQDE